MANPPKKIPLDFQIVDPQEVVRRGKSIYEEANRRRSVREFSDREVPREAIENAILAASTMPSGAHRQPWRFVAVSDPAIKSRIRAAAENEEEINYTGRMPDSWLAALRPFGTNQHKPYLETCPWIVVLFEEVHGTEPDGSLRKNYYVKESVGLAAGMFISAIHRMGLATLTHTPSPMGFLRDLLGRPKNERPFILFPVGYPVDDCHVPDIGRKPLEDVSIWNPETRDGDTIGDPETGEEGGES